jgi:intracellular septation protein
MKQLIDYIPLIAFLVVYKMEERVISLGSFDYNLGGIFSATEILVTASILVYGSIFLVNGKLSRSHLFLLSAVVLFCSFTLIFREEAILKWKAPVVNWIFACVFIGSQYINKQNMTQIMLGHVVELPASKWKTLNFAWAGVFFFLGCTNLFVAFTFHDYWVDFKVFGSMAILLLFSVAQMAYLWPYIEEQEKQKQQLEDQPESGSVSVDSKELPE